MGPMDVDANPGGPSVEDLAMIARLASELADGVVAALPRWVVGSVERVWRAQQGTALPDEVRSDATDAGAAAAAETGGRVRALLALDVDDQATNPLSVLRPAARYPTEVLRRFDVAPVRRDAESARQFPDDPYDLTPMSFADLDPDLHEPGFMWGAAKAHVHLARRRAEGRR
jgi:hypothetical protein